jgi:hypothetical protein
VFLDSRPHRIELADQPSGAERDASDIEVLMGSRCERLLRPVHLLHNVMVVLDGLDAGHRRRPGSAHRSRAPARPGWSRAPAPAGWSVADCTQDPAREHPRRRPAAVAPPDPSLGRSPGTWPARGPVARGSRASRSPALPARRPKGSPALPLDVPSARGGRAVEDGVRPAGWSGRGCPASMPSRELDPRHTRRATGKPSEEPLR